jgi:zinc D-Ala-D-Ala dipeptidase
MKWYYFVFIFLVACDLESEIKTESNEQSVSENAVLVDSTQLIIDSVVSYNLGLINLVDLKKYNSEILVELKYATTDNFMKQQLYDSLNTVYLQKEVAERLIQCQKHLDSIRPGYRLLVYDGVRPRQVQKFMWNALDSIPQGRRGKFVSNPYFGSVHNFGAAVDLTIVDSLGNKLDMGANYDDFREIAFPQHEARFLASGQLSKYQINNRKLLRRVMRSQKFYNIPSEWWHFNAFTRAVAAEKFQLLETESGGSEWFKIPKIKSALEDSLSEQEEVIIAD